MQIQYQGNYYEGFPCSLVLEDGDILGATFAINSLGQTVRRGNRYKTGINTDPVIHGRDVVGISNFEIVESVRDTIARFNDVYAAVIQKQRNYALEYGAHYTSKIHYGVQKLTCEIHYTFSIKDDAIDLEHVKSDLCKFVKTKLPESVVLGHVDKEGFKIIITFTLNRKLLATVSGEDYLKQIKHIFYIMKRNGAKVVVGCVATMGSGKRFILSRDLMKELIIRSCPLRPREIEHGLRDIVKGKDSKLSALPWFGTTEFRNVDSAGDLKEVYKSLKEQGWKDIYYLGNGEGGKCYIYSVGMNANPLINFG